VPGTAERANAEGWIDTLAAPISGKVAGNFVTPGDRWYREREAAASDFRLLLTIRSHRALSPRTVSHRQDRYSIAINLSAHADPPLTWFVFIAVDFLWRVTVQFVLDQD
jgi:hypothetical protein